MGKYSMTQGSREAKRLLGSGVALGMLRRGSRTNTPSYAPGFYHLFFTLLGREKVPKEKTQVLGRCYFIFAEMRVSDVAETLRTVWDLKDRTKEVSTVVAVANLFKACAQRIVK